MTAYCKYITIMLNDVQNGVQQEDQMKKDCNVKEKIIQVTMELIEKSDGHIETITTRTISEKAEVGVGLINYHFQTKENLIEICVQKIIEDVISKFKPETGENLGYFEKIRAAAKSVMDFLMSNPAVSRISILGDFGKPKILDNTMKTVQGFSYSLNELEISANLKTIQVFGFVSILQAAFLRKDLSKELFGFDFYIKEERDAFIDIIAESLFGEC